MRGRFLHSPVLTVALVATSCIPNISIDDPGVQLLCASDEDCPEGFACKAVDDEQRCIALSVLSKDPLEVTSPLTLDRLRVSPIDGNNIVGARFSLSEQPAERAVKFDDDEMSCTSVADDTGIAFTCSYTVAASVGSGVHTVTLRARDAAGNSVRDDFEVVVDADVPDIDAVTIVSGTVRDGAAPAGATLVLAIAFDEPVLSAALRLSSDEPCVHAVDANTVTCTVVVTDEEGPRTISGAVTDVLGNVGEVEAAIDVVVDNTAPSEPTVEAEHAIIYRRAPWGDELHPQPVFALDVAQGAVEAGAFVAVAADAEGRSLLAIGPVGTIDLGSTDHSVVFVASVDAAGNRSAFVDVQEQQWTATLGNKRGTRRFENPHQVFAIANLDERLLNATDVEVATAVATAPGVEGTVSSRAAPTWTPVRSPTLPADRRDHCQAFDAARGEVVVFGGSTSTTANEVLDETWVYADGEWTQRTPAARPSPRRSAACAYDPLRDRVVLIGGEVRGGRAVDEIWEWDGTTWSLTADVMPAPIAHAAAAFSLDELALVVVGGRIDNEDSSQVVVVGTAGVEVDGDSAMPARADAAVATDAEGRVVVFGGSNRGDTWRRSDGAFSLVDIPSPPVGDPPSLALVGDGLLLVTQQRVFQLGADGWGALTSTITQRPGARFTSAGNGVGLHFGGALNESREAGLHWRDDTFTAIVDGAIPTSANDIAYDALTQTTIVNGAGAFFQLPTRRTIPLQAGDLVDAAPGGQALLVTDDGTVLAFSGDEFLQQVPGSIAPTSASQVARVGDDLILVNTSDTWRLPGSVGTWVRETDAPLVSGAALASLGDRAVLIGGQCGAEVCASAQVLDDGVWHSISLERMPPRTATTAVSNPADGTVVIFGGFAEDATPLADVWQWDGAHFGEVDVVGPAARGEHAMGLDPGTGTILVVGGTAFGQPLNDVWLYDTARDARPAVRIAVSAGAAQVDLATLVGIDLSIEATNAAEVAVWQAGERIDVDTSLAGANARRALVGDEAALHVLVPAATVGSAAFVDVETFSATFSFRSAP